MHELRTNPTLRIAAIAFAIFIVVGTILIFTIPDGDSGAGGGLTIEPTLSSANQTSIASYNATTLATTATPQAGVSNPAPTRPGSRPKPPSNAYTGNGDVDRTLNLLVSSSRYDVTDDLDRVEVPCGAAPAVCDGTPSGTLTRYFVSVGCGTELVTDSADAQAFVKRALDNFPAWDIGAVFREGIPGVTMDGYAVGLRAASGNTGELWYLDDAGGVIGVNIGCGGPGWGGEAPDPDQPEAPVLYCSDVGVICPTPSP